MARTDTLPHFLTDVADAIRTKAGTSGTIQASTFDTAISNIPSGGQTQITNITEYDNAIDSLNANLIQNLQDMFDSYPTDTTEAVTLYTPDSDCTSYFIQKRSSGKYRVVWYQDISGTFGTSLSIVTNVNVCGFIYNGFIEYLNLYPINFKISSRIGAASHYQNLKGYFSNEVNTIADVIAGMKTNNGLTYNVPTGNNYAFVEDTPYKIPYSNKLVFDFTSDSNGIPIMSKRISSNETYVQIS